MKQILILKTTRAGTGPEDNPYIKEIP